MDRDRKLVLTATLALTVALVGPAVLVQPELPSRPLGNLPGEPVETVAPHVTDVETSKPVRRATLGRRGTLGGALDRLDVSGDVRAEFLRLAGREIDPGHFGLKKLTDALVCAM